MRRVAYRHYQCDGWLAVANGKINPEARYDPRDFRYGPKCAAYLWGGDPRLLPEMGKRIFFDLQDKDGKPTLDPEHECGIVIAYTAKLFSDYLRYSEQDKFIQDNRERQLKILKWSLANYDRNGDGLIEHGERLPTRLMALLVGESPNSFVWDHTQNDVVVVASMEVCEWLQLLAAYGEAHRLPETGWLKAKAAQARAAIEGRAYDPDAGYYYLLYRAGEKKWYHSGRGINEASRELDVTPYYAAFVGGDDARGKKVAEYARGVLMDRGIFPMPLIYPFYNFSPAYPADGFVGCGCWEESYYNCVRAWAKYGMHDAVYEAVKRRSEAYLRDRDCREWYMPDGTHNNHFPSRDRYGISAAAHISAIIEGLFGITPTRFGFGEVNIWPALPASWADKPATIGVALPGGGFLKYTYRFNKEARTVRLTIETDKQREGHFRVPVPGRSKSVTWNGEPIWCEIAGAADRRWQSVGFEKPFTKAVLEIKIESP